MFGNLGVHVHQFPSGKWGFVGTIPDCLAYTMADGSPLTEQAREAIHQCGAGILGKSVRRVAFATEQEAIAAMQATLAAIG